MKIELFGNLEQAKEVELLMQEWTEALHEKDAELMAHYYGEDAKVFDIGCQTEGRDAYKKLWLSCFPYFGETISIERQQTTIHATDGLAFLYGYVRLSGGQSDDPANLAWSRVTVCCQKIKGTWKVIHEHVSMPIDFAQNKPVLLLEVPERGG